MRPMKQVVCVGNAVLDHVFQLPIIPKTPVKCFAKNYFQACGGTSLRAAVAISRAGGQAVFWGRLGNDHNGHLILEELEELGVDVRDVLTQQDVKSGVSSVLVDSEGERLITNYNDPKLISDANWLEQNLIHHMVRQCFILLINIILLKFVMEQV